MSQNVHVGIQEPELVYARKGEVDALRAEIARLQEAKRAALKVADERSAENVKLRKLAEMARTVLDTFREDEAQGYRSKDRQFAIELLAKGFEIAALDEQTARAED